MVGNGTGSGYVKGKLRMNSFSLTAHSVLRLGEVRAMTFTSAGLYIRSALHFTPYFAKPFVSRSPF